MNLLLNNHVYLATHGVNVSFKLDPTFTTKSLVSYQLYAKAMNPTAISLGAYIKGLERLAIFT